MSRLTVEPPGPVTSLEELFAIAYALEHEAATHYEQLASRMRTAGDASLADTFSRLATEERRHLDSVVRWSETEKGKAPDAAHLRWLLPETFNDEGASTAAPEIQSGYGALSMAVRNEERAFAFWSYVAAHAGTPEIGRAAERMAHEELEHVAALRRERRRAYHAQRAQTPLSKGNATADTAALEERLADLMESLASETGSGKHFSPLAQEARRSAEELAQGSLSLPPLAVSTLSLDDPLVLAELLVERYLEAADRPQDEAGLSLAQTLASRSINRLAWLRANLQPIGRN